MKSKYYFIILFLIAIISCENKPQRETIEVKICKEIKAKDAPIENRVSGTELFFGNGSITKSQSVYYFYYTDGSSAEVDRSIYFKYDIGSKYCITKLEYK